MYDLVGRVYDDDRPAAEAFEAVRPATALGGGRLLATLELPARESESAENTSSSPKGSVLFPDMIDEVRRRLKTPDMLAKFEKRAQSPGCCAPGSLSARGTVVCGYRYPRPEFDAFGSGGSGRVRQGQVTPQWPSELPQSA